MLQVLGNKQCNAWESRNIFWGIIAVNLFEDFIYSNTLITLIEWYWSLINEKKKSNKSWIFFLISAAEWRCWMLAYLITICRKHERIDTHFCKRSIIFQSPFYIIYSVILFLIFSFIIIPFYKLPYMSPIQKFR
jgi:hypothetical protein